MSDRITNERLDEKIELSKKIAAMLSALQGELNERTWCIIHDLVVGNQQNLQALKSERETNEELIKRIDELESPFVAARASAATALAGMEASVEYVNYVEQAAFEDGLEKGRKESAKLIMELIAQVNKTCTWTKVTTNGFELECKGIGLFFTSADFPNQPYCPYCGGKIVESTND